MKLHQIPYLCSVVLASLFMTSSTLCYGIQKNNPIQVRLDPAMTDKLMVPQADRLSGGDGCISIDLGNKESLFLWGDSFLGEVWQNTRKTDAPLVFGNIFLKYKDGVSTTYHGGTAEHPAPLLSTDSIDGHRVVLWPEHGFVKNNILHLVLSDIVFTGTGTWDFYWHSASYCRLSLPDFKLIDKVTLSAKDLGNIHYGFGFLPVKDYMYFYGVKTDAVGQLSKLYVARAKVLNDKLANYEFYAAGKWLTDAGKAIALKGVDVSVSEQFSVFFHDKHYFLITQEKGIGANDIYSFVADSPTGPWYNKKKIYTTPEPVKNPTVFSYNAMAHPQFIKNGEVLISYCVNAMNIPDLFTDASIYRPRFFWVKLSDLLQ